MTLWKIIVIGMGLLTLRRMIQGFPVWDVRLSDGRVIRVLEARRDRDDMNAFADDPSRVHGKRFKVTFDGDEMSPPERTAVMSELAAWAAVRSDSSDCGRVLVIAAVRVVDRRLWRSHRHAEWQEFRRLPDGSVELLREGRFGQRMYPGKQTDRSRPNG
jgi:hypothetical protein